MAKATLTILTGSRAGQSVGLREDSYVIGSDEGAAITCLDPEVEWSHARIYHSKDRFWVEDLQSRSGVLVNDRPVLHKSLRDGDQVRIGQVTFAVALDGASVATAVGPAEAAGAALAAASRQASGAPPARPPAEPKPAPAEATPSGAASDAPGGGAPLAAEPRPTSIDQLMSEMRGALGAERHPLAPAAPAERTAPAARPDALVGPAPAAERLPAPDLAPSASSSGSRADVDELRRRLERQQEENQDLKSRLATLEAELARKSSGLSLATESFVEQLERAKERIQTFAKKHTESEERARRQTEEIDRLKAEKAALEADSYGRCGDLTEKLETVRRDFEEIERLLRSKGQAYAKLVAEARELAKAGPRPGSAAAAEAAQQLAQGLGVALAPGEAGGAESAQLASSTAARRGRASGIVATAVSVEELEGSAAGGRAPGPKPPPEADPLDGATTGGRRRGRGGRMRTPTIAAIFVLLFCFAFMLFILVQKLGTRRDPSPSVAGGSTRPNEGTKRTTFTTEGLPQGKPAAKPDAARAEEPKRAEGAAAPKPAEPKPAQPAGPSPAPAAEAEGDVLAALREAHRSRDDDRIKAEEQALIARGQAVVDEVRRAYDEEKQFQLKVSLQYVLMTIEGTGGGQSVVDRMRATQDAGEKMRLAFMLLKLGPSEVPALERALAAEQDPMIRKYIVRALGEASGSADPAAGGGDPAGLETLQKMASAGDDRQLRIEAIRAIERRSSPEVSKFLAELAAQEDGKDAQIRSIAIRALANVGGAEQGDFFTQVLQRDDRVNNRAEAAKFFARAGTGRDLAVLEPLAQKEQVHYIKEKLDTAVEQIKKREGIR